MSEAISAALLGVWAGTSADFTAALQQRPLEAKPDPMRLGRDVTGELCLAFEGLAGTSGCY